MGWSGGTPIAQGIWDSVKKYIPEKDQPKVANEIIDILEDEDWDNLYEVDELYELSGRKAADEEEERKWERSWSKNQKNTKH